MRERRSGTATLTQDLFFSTKFLARKSRIKNAEFNHEPFMSFSRAAESEVLGKIPLLPLGMTISVISNDSERSFSRLFSQETNIQGFRPVLSGAPRQARQSISYFTSLRCCRR